MNTISSRWSMVVTAATVLVAVLAPQATVASEPQPVVAQQLHSPKASKKIGAVLWTRRPDSYTLQIVFARTGGITGIVDGQSILGPQGQHPVVTAWLLRADGSAIVTKRTPSLAEPQKPGLPVEILYAAPLAEGKEAVAIAIRIENDYFVEAIPSL